MQLIILPLVSALIAQIIKFIISPSRKFNWNSLTSYGGMPSGHTAIVISLATIIVLKYGWTSPLFAFSAIFAFIVIRDAIGLRQYLGRHGKVINALVKDLKDDDMLDEKYPHLLEKIGHTPVQVLIGGIIGVAVSAIGYWFF